ncbi:MAG: RNA polymerase sigma factor SigZ [Planctomycetota bacterium]
MSDAGVSTERLWELLSDRLRGFFAQRVRDPQAAEDLLQETFVRIHGGLEELSDRDRIEAWVFRIAHNLVIDLRRARGSDDVDQPDDLAEREPEPPDNLNHVVGGWLPAMVAELPERYRAAVQLYELEGVPQREVAQRLGLSLSGAKSRVQRGREKLKELLFDCCSFERDRRGNVIGFRRNRGCGRDTCDPCDGGDGD